MSGTPDPASPGLEPDPQPEDTDLDPVIDDLDIDAEPEPEPEPEEAEPEPEPPPRLTRRERQQENWRERAIRAEAERDILQRQPQPRQQPVVDPRAAQQAREAEYERISMLPPTEQIGAIHQMMQRETALARLEAFDLSDRQNFNRLQETHSAARRLAPRVEEVLQQQRANGIYAFSREQVFDYLYGNELRTRGAQTTRRERDQGAARVARQTVRPSRGGRGDVPSTGRRGRSQDDIDRDLLNTPIGDTM